MIQEQVDAIMKIQKIEDLPRGAANFVYVTGSLPLVLSFPILLEYYFPWVIRSWFDKVLFLGKGHRFGTAGLLFVLALFWTDDIGTAVGMQAEEVPRNNIEGNHFMSGAWQFLIDNGLAKTQTDAHRLVWIYFTSIILGAQYFGWFNSLARFMMMLLGIVKTWAGYAWWKIKPNNYTVMDFLSFKPGRMTHERLSIPMRILFNLHSGHGDPVAEAQGITFVDGNYVVAPGSQADIHLTATGGYTKRRRLATSPTPGVTWLTRYLPIIFPFI